MKRVILFVLTNIAVVAMVTAVTGVVCYFFGVSLVESVGADWTALILIALVYGFFGAFISLLLSKTIAKWSCGARTIKRPRNEAERWLVDTVAELARQANIETPEVAIYEGEANAFATGAFKNHALVAVSTSIMEQMTKEELRAVLGHEISHVANGDMVTMTLVQGVLNAFVVFVSRALAYLLVKGNDSSRRRSNNNLPYFLLVMVFDIVLGFLAGLVVCWFSRRREYAADAGSARLLGSPMPMIAALQRLGNLKPGVLPQSLSALGISPGRRRMAHLFSTHPPLSARIEALRNLTLDPTHMA